MPKRARIVNEENLRCIRIDLPAVTIELRCPEGCIDIRGKPVRYNDSYLVAELGQVLQQREEDGCLAGPWTTNHKMDEWLMTTASIPCLEDGSNRFVLLVG